MKNGLKAITSRETLIPGIVSLVLMTGLLVLLIITGYLFAANTDERIASTARKAFVSQACLKEGNIQVDSLDGAVTLTGTVAEELHASLAVATVANLPGVKRVDNRLEIRAHEGSVPRSSLPGLSGHGLRNASK